MSTFMRRISALICMLPLAVAACDGGASDSKSTANAGPKLYKELCTVEGLTKPLRQTIIIVDQAHLQPTQGGADFRAKNGATLDAILAIADPEKAISSGLLDPREQVSVLMAPASGASPVLLFAGCAPGYSEAEITKLQSGTSGIGQSASTFVGSGVRDTLRKQADEYRTQLVGAINVASKGAPSQPPAGAASFAQTSLVASLKSASKLFDPENGAPRIFLIAPEALSGVGHFPDVKTARRAGFAAASEARLDFGDAEVAVSQSGGSASKEFMNAFLLGSSGALVAWSDSAPTDLPGSPRFIKSFRGEIKIGNETFPAQARVSIDANGHLVNSWIEMRGGVKKAIPMTGIATCDPQQNCLLRSDDGGFAHRYDSDPDPHSVGLEPSNPFGGMRHFEMEIQGKKLSGRVFDPLISQIGNDPSQKDFKFSLNEGL